MEQYRGLIREQIRAFGAVGELLPMALGLNYGPGHGAAAKILDAFLAALKARTLQEAEMVEVVKAMVSSVVHPEVWRRFLLIVVQLPSWRTSAASVLSSGALLVNPETRSAAGHLLSALSSTLDGADHAELVEMPIRRAAALFPADEGEWRDRVTDQLLGCLEVEKIQDPELRSRLETLLAAGDPPRPAERAEVDATWQPVDLSDIVGHEVHEALTETAKDALDALRAALTATEGAAVEGSALLELEDALRRAVEANGPDVGAVQELITRAAERLAREGSVRPETPIGELVAKILIDATNEDQP